MPAISVGNAIKKLAPDAVVFFVCGQREQELGWYRSAGIEPFCFPAQPIQRGIMANVRSAAALAANTVRARGLLKRLGAGAVLGMGGYVAAPACLAAMSSGIPVLIHEQNAIAGRANRWLAKGARIVAGGYREIEKSAPRGRFHWTGNPVRETIGTATRRDACARLGLNEERPVLAITGGSQGARDLNRFVGEALRLLDARTAGCDSREKRASLQTIWACGREKIEECRSEYSPDSFHRIDARLFPFVEDMAPFLGAAWLIVSRAGASTLAEIALCGLPAILFPLRTAIVDHQARNADALVSAGAAIRMSEFDDSPKSLADAIDALVGDPRRLQNMGDAARRLAKPDAATDLARLALDSMGQERR